MVVAIPFLPIDLICAALDKLQEYEFDQSSPYLDKMIKFKEYFLLYIEETWLHGSYQPRMWNYWMKPSGVTNNRLVFAFSSYAYVVAVVQNTKYVFRFSVCKRIRNESYFFVQQ